MYLMQTVSTVPRARHLQAQSAAVPAARSRSVDRDGEAALLFPVSPAPPPTAQQRRLSGEAAAAADAGPADLETDKKKKWSLGGLFRRRRKPAVAAPNDSDSTSGDEAAGRRGFLGRRRSRRDQKRKTRPKIVGTFDHIVVNPLPQSPVRPRRDVDPTSLPPPSTPPIPSAASPPSSPPQSHPAGRRRDSSLSRCSSGGSGSLDGTGRRGGRRGRAMARAEALRDQQHAESSSDECGGFCQSPSLSRSRPDDSPSSGRRTRAALRTERHFRRLSRDEEANSSAAPRVPRADGGRWTNAVLLQESCDMDPSLLTRTPSATPSPKQSPLVRPRQFRHYSPSTVVDTACTFPPSHGFWAPSARPPPPMQACGGPSLWTYGREASPIPAVRRPDYQTPQPPRPFPSFETVCAKPAISCGDNFPQRSVSYDCDIHQPAGGSRDVACGAGAVAAPDDVLHVQFSIARPAQVKAAPPPPPRDPQRRLSAAPAADSARPMSYAFETGSPQMARIEHSLNQPAVLERGVAGSLRSLGAPSSGAWAIHQWRSSSENQLSAPKVRPRPASVTPDVMHSSVNGHTSFKNSDVPSAHFQYFTDQQPRSRRPIHIQLRGGPPANDQTYLSDSQVVMKPPYMKNPLLNATEFWRQREQLQQQNVPPPNYQQQGPPARAQRKHFTALNKPSLVEQMAPRSGALQHSAAPLQPLLGSRSRSNSPPSTETQRGVRGPKPGRPFAGLVRPTDSQSSLSGTSDTATPSGDTGDGGPRPLSMVLENAAESTAELQSPVQASMSTHPTSIQPLQAAPPAPPMRRFSRQSSTSSLEAVDWACDDASTKKQRRSSNLEDALNELEAIYKSLRLGDEDLLEQAERRETPAFRPHPPTPPEGPWRARCGTESDSGFSYGCEWMRRHRPLGAPDRVTDDMAYRRLHPKDRPSSQDARALLSQAGSFLQASPALALGDAATSPVLALIPTPDPAPEPDVMHDDVLFRSIKHANNTLRIQDPQPPFGIPLGPVPSASNSDYLHVIPVERNRSSFKPCKVPDVVKDDLAFRALRKDSQKESCLPPPRLVNGVEALFPARSTEISNFSLRKKRAVRSLSASLMGLIHREPHTTMPTTAYSAASHRDHEKAQSLSDLPDALQVAQEILEGKETIGGGSRRLRVGQRPVGPGEPPEGIDPHYGVAGTSWVERALLDRSLGASAGASTSTETLTDSRANQGSALSHRSTLQPSPSPPPPSTFERKGPSPSPAEAPAPDQTRLDELLIALAREASATSERLDRELQQLGLGPDTALDSNCNVVSARMKSSPEAEGRRLGDANASLSAAASEESTLAAEQKARKPLPSPLPPAELSPKSASLVAAAAAATAVETQQRQEVHREETHKSEHVTQKRRHDTVDELVSQCRRDLDELLRQVDAATRPATGTEAASPEGEAAAAVPSSPWNPSLEPLTALGLALALILSLLAMQSL